MRKEDLLYYKSEDNHKQDACLVVVQVNPKENSVILDQYTNWENGAQSQVQYRGRQELPIQEAEQNFKEMTGYDKIKAFSESISATFFKQTPQYIDFHRYEQDANVHEAAMFAHQSAIGALMIATLDKTPMELCEEASYFEGPYAFDDVTPEEDKDYYVDSSFYVGTYAGCNIYYDISAALDENKNPEVDESGRNGFGGYGYIENMGGILLIDIPEDVRQKVQKQAGEYIKKEFLNSEPSTFLDVKEDKAQTQNCVTEKPRLHWSTQSPDFYNNDQFKYNDNSEDYEGHAQFTFTVGEYRDNPVHVDISGYVDNNNEVSVYGDDSDCGCGYVSIDGTETLIAVPDEVMEKVKAQAAKLTLLWNAEAEKRKNLQENDFEIREGNSMILNDRQFPIDNETKTLMVIEVQKQDENGNSYVVAAAAQSSEEESLKNIVKEAIKGVSDLETLSYKLESYIAAHEKYAEAAKDSSNIKLRVSSCENGEILMTEEKAFSLEQFKNKDIKFERTESKQHNTFKVYTEDATMEHHGEIYPNESIVVSGTVGSEDKDGYSANVNIEMPIENDDAKEEVLVRRLSALTKNMDRRKEEDRIPDVKPSSYQSKYVDYTLGAINVSIDVAIKAETDKDAKHIMKQAIGDISESIKDLHPDIKRTNKKMRQMEDSLEH